MVRTFGPDVAHHLHLVDRYHSTDVQFVQLRDEGSDLVLVIDDENQQG